MPSGGGETIKEIALREKSEQDARDRDHPAFKHPLLANARLIEIRKTAPTSSSDNTVIAADFTPSEDET